MLSACQSRNGDCAWSVVVRQRQRGLGRDAGAARAKKRCGLPMPGRGGHARPAGERRQRTGRAALDLARVAGSSHIRAWRGRAAGAASGGPGTPTLVTTASTSRSRLAGSRSGRPAAGGHCRSRARPAPRFHVARQRQVLQAVVRDDHVHVGMRAQRAPGQPARLGCTETGAPLARAIRRARRRMPTQPAPRPCPTRGSGPIFARSLG